MSQTDPQSQDQYIIAFSPNKLLLAVCSLLMLMVLSVMLGIRIERFQHRENVSLEARANIRSAPPAPAATLATAAAPTPIPATAAAKQALAAQAKPKTTRVGAKPAVAKAATSKVARATTTPKPKAAPSRPAVNPIPAVQRTLAAKPKPAAPAPTRTIKAEDLPDTIPPTPILLTKAAAPRVVAPRRAQPTAARTARTMSTSRAAATAHRKYVVQVVSSRNRAQADTRARLLAGLGIPAFVESADLGKKGVWHRVLAGTFGSKTEATAVLAKLKTDPQFASSFVRPY